MDFTKLAKIQDSAESEEIINEEVQEDKDKDLGQFVMNLILKKELECPVTGAIWKLEKDEEGAYKLLKDGEEVAEISADLFSAVDEIKAAMTEKVEDADNSDEELLASGEEKFIEFEKPTEEKPFFNMYYHSQDDYSNVVTADHAYEQLPSEEEATEIQLNDGDFLQEGDFQIVGKGMPAFIDALKKFKEEGYLK